jgi:acetolactate synthase-1/2/3 large subunit
VNLGDRLVDVLKRAGVDAAFGVPGGQTLPFYAACRARGLRHVLMRDERAAACAADAYARLSGTVGVCDATVGPGVTNLISGLAEALASSVPVLAIIADIPGRWEHLRRRGVASQAIDQPALLGSVCKWIATVHDAAAFDDVFDQALRVAVSGRPGPVALEIPEDVFQQEPGPEGSRLAPEAFRYPRFRAASSPSQIDEAVSILARARRPLILAGGGVLLSEAGAAVSALSSQTGIPVATTINGKGAVDESDGLALGVVGVFGNVRAGRALAAADVLLVLGSKLDQLSMFNWRLPRADQVVIHVDVDPEEIGRTCSVKLGIVADAREAARLLADALTGQELSLEPGWTDALSDEGQPGTKPGDPAVAPERVVHEIGEALQPDDVLVSDASLASGWAAQHFRVKKVGRSFLAPRGLAGIGWACGAAVGARMATAREQRVLCLAGDGAWAYSMAEVETAARLGLNITYVVLNNSTLGWIRHAEQYLEISPTSDFSSVDFAAVAVGMGAKGYRVTAADELPDALASALAAEGPALVDVSTSPDASPIVGFRKVRGGGA